VRSLPDGAAGEKGVSTRDLFPYLVVDSRARHRPREPDNNPFIFDASCVTPRFRRPFARVWRSGTRTTLRRALRSMSPAVLSGDTGGGHGVLVSINPLCSC